MKTLTQAILFAVAAVCGAAAASAAPPAAPPSPAGEAAGEARGLRAWWENPQVVERLNLTSEQQKRIQELVFRHTEKMIDLRAEKQRAQLDLSRLLDAEALNEGALDKAAETLDAAQCSIERAQTRLRIEIARILNREQRLALRELVRERGEQIRRTLRDTWRDRRQQPQQR